MDSFSSSRASNLLTYCKIPKFSKNETLALVLVPFFLLVIIYANNFPHDFSLLRRGGTTPVVAAARSGAAAAVTCNTAANNVSTSPNTTSPPLPDLRILIGVLTMPDKYEVRHLLRLVNSFQPKPTAVQINLKFVFCNLTSGEQRALVSLEALRYDDIMILNCAENMNDGKTYLFFSTVAKIFGKNSKGGGADGKKPYYDYVMKADDDTYIQFTALAASLNPLPRLDLYYGFYVDPGWFREGDPAFMAGMGYVLSWDLVDWIATSKVARNLTIGFEDRLVGMWFRDGGRGKNIYDTKPSIAQWEEFQNNTGRVVDDKWFMYDLPKPPARYLPKTVCVHRVKDRWQWENVIRHFNLTAGTRPSEFHNLD